MIIKELDTLKDLAHNEHLNKTIHAIVSKLQKHNFNYIPNIEQMYKQLSKIEDVDSYTEQFFHYLINKLYIIQYLENTADDKHKISTILKTKTPADMSQNDIKLLKNLAASFDDEHNVVSMSTSDLIILIRKLKKHAQTGGGEEDLKPNEGQTEQGPGQSTEQVQPEQVQPEQGQSKDVDNGNNGEAAHPHEQRSVNNDNLPDDVRKNLNDIVDTANGIVININDSIKRYVEKLNQDLQTLQQNQDNDKLNELILHATKMKDGFVIALKTLLEYINKVKDDIEQGNAIQGGALLDDATNLMKKTNKAYEILDNFQQKSQDTNVNAIKRYIDELDGIIKQATKLQTDHHRQIPKTGIMGRMGRMMNSITNNAKSLKSKVVTGLQGLKPDNDARTEGQGDKSVDWLIKMITSFLHELYEFIKIVFKDWKEICLFIITLGLIGLIIVLFYYSSIQKEVNSKSRCVRERRKGQQGGIYLVEARNEYSDPLYTVSYDLGSKKFDVNCACKPGNTVNHFTDIKVYDQRNPASPIRKIPDQICQCDRLVEPITTYYDGFPDLLRFMNNNDTSFFTNVENSR